MPAVAVPGCSAGLRFPVVWRAEARLNSDSALKLNGDGTGDAQRLQYWSGSGECGVQNADTYTGPVDWVWNGDSYREIVVSFPSGGVLVGSDGTGPVSHSWKQVAVALCGEQSSPYDLLIYEQAD